MNFTDMSQSKSLNYMLAGITVFIWGITFVSTKYLLNSFSSFEILILRYVTAYIALWIIKPGLLRVPDWKSELLFAGAGLTGVTFYQFMENTAINYTLPANVSIIVSICPMLTAIISQIVLKEKFLNLFFNIGFLVAITGIVLVSFNGIVQLHISPKGDLLALGSAMCWALYSLFVSKVNGMKLDPIKSTRRIFFWALFFMIPISIYGIINENPKSIAVIIMDPEINSVRWGNFWNWFNLGFLGFGASAMAFVFWNFAARNLGTVKTTVLIYLSPVVTILFAWLILGDRMTWMGAAGAALTICGLLISRIKKNINKLEE